MDMTKIDPILPLAVQIAEGRGQFAFFLGSGVSRAAGIPSGWGVRQHTLKDLYRMQENIEKINENAFEKWLESTGFVNASYSSIIDALREKPQQREYLANFFAGKEPTEAHYALARLIKCEMVRVIITTNFDPLMEHALDAEGVSYSVVASDAELKDAEPREHCRCRIIKPHGDWQDLNLRNSDEEVAELLTASHFIADEVV
jgi:NAD-dependent SIR2 family protein deacetylase